MPRILNYASPSSTRKRPAVGLAWAAKILAGASLVSFLGAVCCVIVIHEMSGHDGLAVVPYFLVAVFTAATNGLLALIIGQIARRQGTYVRHVGKAAAAGGIIFFLIAGIIILVLVTGM